MHYVQQLNNYMYAVACTIFAKEVNSDIRFPMGNQYVSTRSVAEN